MARSQFRFKITQLSLAMLAILILIYLTATVLMLAFNHFYTNKWYIAVVGFGTTFHIVAIPVIFYGFKKSNPNLLIIGILLLVIWSCCFVFHIAIFAVFS